MPNKLCVAFILIFFSFINVVLCRTFDLCWIFIVIPPIDEKRRLKTILFMYCSKCVIDCWGRILCLKTLNIFGLNEPNDTQYNSIRKSNRVSSEFIINICCFSRNNSDELKSKVTVNSILFISILYRSLLAFDSFRFLCLARFAWKSIKQTKEKGTRIQLFSAVLLIIFK